MECTQVLFSEYFAEKETVEKIPVATLLIEGIYHTIFNKENFIGRDDSCDIIIKNSAVSSKHAVVDAEDITAHFIRDLSSTNKTKLGKVTLKPNVGYAINDGDCITFGNVSATYNISKQAPTTPEKHNTDLIPETPEKENLSILMESPGADKNDGSVADKSQNDMFDERTRDSIINTGTICEATKDQRIDHNDTLGTMNFEGHEFLNHLKQSFSSNKSIVSDPLVINDSDEEANEEPLAEKSVNEKANILRNPLLEIDEGSVEVARICLENTENHQTNTVGNYITKQELEVKNSLTENSNVDTDVKGKESPIDIVSNNSVLNDDTFVTHSESRANSFIQNEEQLDEDLFIPASQNEDIFESSGKDLNISINNTFGSFSDSGDESLLQVTTQQLKEELSVSNLLPEEKDFDQHPEKLVEFLEPCSQPFDGNEESVIKENVSEIDETLSSTISSNIFEASRQSAPEDKDLFSPGIQNDLIIEPMAEVSKEKIYKSVENKLPEAFKNKLASNNSFEQSSANNNMDGASGKGDLLGIQSETQLFVKEDASVKELKNSNQIHEKTLKHKNTLTEKVIGIDDVNLSSKSLDCEKLNMASKKYMEYNGHNDSKPKQSNVTPKVSCKLEAQNSIKISDSLEKNVSDTSDSFNTPELLCNIREKEETPLIQYDGKTVTTLNLSFTQNLSLTQPVKEDSKSLNVSKVTKPSQDKASDILVDMKAPSSPTKVLGQEVTKYNKTECKLKNLSLTSASESNFTEPTEDSRKEFSDISTCLTSPKHAQVVDVEIADKFENENTEIKISNLTFTQSFYEASTQPFAAVKDDDAENTKTMRISESPEKDTSVNIKEFSGLDVNDAKIKSNDTTLTEGFYDAPTQPWTETNDDHANIGEVTESPEKVTFKTPAKTISKVSGLDLIGCNENDENDIRTTNMTFTQGFYEAPTQPWTENDDDTNNTKVTEFSKKETFKTPSTLLSKVSDLKITGCNENHEADIESTQGFYEAPTQPMAENNDEIATKSGLCSEKETADISVIFETHPGKAEYNKNGITEMKATDMTFTQGFYEAPTQPMSENNDENAIKSGVCSEKETADITLTFETHPGKAEHYKNGIIEMKATDMTFTQGFYEAPTQPMAENNDENAIESGDCSEKETADISVIFETHPGKAEHYKNEITEMKATDMTFTQGFYEAPTQPMSENNDKNAIESGDCSEKETADISVIFETHPGKAEHYKNGITEMKATDMTFTQGFYEAPTQPMSENNDENAIESGDCSEKETADISVIFETHPGKAEHNKNGITEMKATDTTFTQGFYEASTQPCTENNDENAIKSGACSEKETTDISIMFETHPDDICDNTNNTNMSVSAKESLKNVRDSELYENNAKGNEIKTTDDIVTEGFYEAPTQPWFENNDNKNVSKVTESTKSETTDPSLSFKTPSEPMRKISCKVLQEGNENNDINTKLSDTKFTQGFYEAETQPWVENKDFSNVTKINESIEKEVADNSVRFKIPSKLELPVGNEKCKTEIKLPDMAFTQGFYEAPTQPWIEKDSDSTEKDLNISSDTAVNDPFSKKVENIARNELPEKDSVVEDNCPKESEKLTSSPLKLKESVGRADKDSVLLFSESFYEAPTQPYNPNVDNMKNTLRDNEETSDIKALDELLSCFEAPTKPFMNESKTVDEPSKIVVLVSSKEDSNHLPNNGSPKNNDSEAKEEEVSDNSVIKMNEDSKIEISNKLEEIHKAPIQQYVENNTGSNENLDSKGSIDASNNQQHVSQDLLVCNNNLPEEVSFKDDNVKDSTFTQGFYEAETQPFIDPIDNNDVILSNSESSKTPSEPLNEIVVLSLKLNPKENQVSDSKDSIYELDTEPSGSEEKHTLSPLKENSKPIEPSIYELDTEPFSLPVLKKDLHIKDDLEPSNPLSLKNEDKEKLSCKNIKSTLVPQLPNDNLHSQLTNTCDVKMDLSDSVFVNSVPPVNLPKGSDKVTDMTLECNADISSSYINAPDVPTEDNSANKESLKNTSDKLDASESAKTREATLKDVNTNKSTSSDLIMSEFLKNKEEYSQGKGSFEDSSTKFKVFPEESTDSSQELNIRFKKKGCSVFPPDTQDLNETAESCAKIKNEKPKNEKLMGFFSEDSENSSEEFNIKFQKKGCNVFPSDTQEINENSELSTTGKHKKPMSEKIIDLVDDSENSSQEFSIKFQKKDCNVFPPDTEDLNEIAESSTNIENEKLITKKTLDLCSKDDENSSQDSNLKYQRKDCNVSTLDTLKETQNNKELQVDHFENASQEFNIKFQEKTLNVSPPDTQEGTSISLKNKKPANEKMQINIDGTCENSSQKFNIKSPNESCNVISSDSLNTNAIEKLPINKKDKPINKQSKSSADESFGSSSLDISSSNDTKGNLRRSRRSVKVFRKNSQQNNSTTNIELKCSDDLSTNSTKKKERELRKRESYESQNDSQSSNFDYSEGDDLGRGKRKRVKTSFDGFVMEEDLKVYRKKSVDSPTSLSESQSRKSQRLSAKKETTNYIDDSAASSSKGIRNLKVVLHDIKNSKPTAQTHKSPSSIISADDDDDLILLEPSKKNVSLKLNNTKNNSSSKPEVKSQSFSFCDKLDELFDIWGPADTVKLTPRTAKKTAKLLESVETSSKKNKKNILQKTTPDLEKDAEMPTSSQKKTSKSTSITDTKVNKAVAKDTITSPKHKMNEVISEAPVEKKPRKKTSESESVEPIKHVEGLRVTRTSNRKKSDSDISEASASTSKNIERSSVIPQKKKKLSNENESTKVSSENISNDNTNKSRKVKSAKKTSNKLISKKENNSNEIKLSSPTTSYPDDVMLSQEFSFHERAIKHNSTSSKEFPSPQEIRRSSRSKKAEKNKEEKKVEKVMFTGFTDRKLTSLVPSLGGEVVESPFTCTVLVTDKVKRTTKFLSALSRGLPIVTPDWLHASSKAGRFSDFEEFIVSDKEAEKKFSFSLKDSLKKSSTKKLLDGWTIFVTPSVKPPPEEIKVIVECSGGKFLNREPARWVLNSLVISCKEDQSKWNNLKKKGKAPPIVGTEALFSGILQQKIDIRSHCLV